MSPKFGIGQKVRWSGVPARPFFVREQREFTADAYKGKFSWVYDLASGREGESGVCGVKQQDLSPWSGESWDSEAI